MPYVASVSPATKYASLEVDGHLFDVELRGWSWSAIDDATLETP